MNRGWDLSWWTTPRIAALAAVLQVVVLVVAAIVALRQVREARRLRLVQAQPYVVVSLQIDPDVRQAIELVIENIGYSVATDIRVTLDPPLTSSLDREPGDHTEWIALKSGVPTLVPGQRLSHLVDMATSRYGQGVDLPERSTATVEYEGNASTPGPYRYTYVLDFSIWRNSHYVGRKTFDDLVKAVERLTSEVNSLRESGGGIRAVVFDGEAVELERRSRIMASMSSATPASGRSSWFPRWARRSTGKRRHSGRQTL